jgi:lysozyme family protein
MRRNVPIFTFVARQWLLILVMFAGFTAVLDHHKFRCFGSWELNEQTGQWFIQSRTIFDYFGGAAYMPGYGTLIILLALFYVHLIYRETIDKDTHSGKLLEDWRSCSSETRVWVHTVVRIGLIIALCILGASFAKAEPVDQVSRWKKAQVSPKWSIAADMAVRTYERNKYRYQKIQAMVENGVPAPILFCLHYRESDADFRCHAHEGSSLAHRTRDEPKGRLPHPEPPYSFEQSAYDAYYVCERPPLNRIKWSDMQAALDKMESFNGFGYRAKGIPAPYLYSGTSLYTAGKYVADHRFDRTAVDRQLGCVAILKRMAERGITLPFG